MNGTTVVLDRQTLKEISDLASWNKSALDAWLEYSPSFWGRIMLAVVLVHACVSLGAV